MFDAEFFRLVLAIAWGVGIVGGVAYIIYGLMVWLDVESASPFGEKDAAFGGCLLITVAVLLFLAGSGYFIYRGLR